MGTTIVNAPIALPINLAEAKLWVRATYDDDDVLIKALIRAATEYAEVYTQKILVGARVKTTYDAFPTSGFYSGFVFNNPHARPKNALYLERGRVQNVVSVNYLDTGGVVQTFDPSLYVVDYSSDPVRITPVFGQVWPIPQPQIASVWVIYDVGYAAPIKTDIAANTITPSNWPVQTVGSTVRFSNSGGLLPAPLQPDTDYFILSATNGAYTLSLTSGGAVIDITDVGSGTSFLGEVPESAKGWMSLRLAGLYENREDLTSAQLQPHPYVDRLLDGLKTWEF
jgi:uncharacterized phiE125 gp8 family phage protein